MLLVAEALGKQVTAMVGIAAAPDFTDWDFDAADRATIAANGRIERPSDYGYDPMVITQDFWQSGQSNLRLTGQIGIDCPVRLIHGQNDPDVPWETSLKLAAALRSSDVQTILLKDGDHRLSRDQDIALLIDVVGKLARSIRI
jgi:pimeloyl-ACP methyl ester carboxylesterase